MEDTQLFKRLKIKSKFGSYEVFFEKSKINFKKNENYIYVVDKNIYNLYKSNFANLSRILIIDPNEYNKSFEEMSKYLGFFQKKKSQQKIYCNMYRRRYNSRYFIFYMFYLL